MTKKFADIPAKELAPGIIGKYIHTENVTIGYVDIKQDAVLPSHSHEHEQTTHILTGKLEMTIAGVTKVLISGSITIIPPNIIHSAVALSDCTVIDTFYPIRKDYK